MTAFAVVLLWALYHVREVLLLLYISGLFAIGFSPIVRLIERQRLLPVGTRRFPRWLAILVLYVFIVGSGVAVGMLMFPPLVDQAEEWWNQKDRLCDQAQRFLHERGLRSGEFRTLEAVRERGPEAAADGSVVAAGAGARRARARGTVGLLAVRLLPLYVLV